MRSKARSVRARTLYCRMKSRGCLLARKVQVALGLRRKRLVIVASAPLQRDFSRFIDSADCVVRFNNCKNYGRQAGTRTDILYLNNTGDPDVQRTLRFFLKPRTPAQLEAELPYRSSARAFYFVRPPAHYFQALMQDRLDQGVQLAGQELPRHSHGRDIAAEVAVSLRLPADRTHRLSAQFHDSVIGKLEEFGIGDALFPSTGMLGVEHILSCEDFAGYDIVALGFGFSGWEGHPWEAERQLMQRYAREGRLSLLGTD